VGLGSLSAAGHSSARPPHLLHTDTVARATWGFALRRPGAGQHPEQAGGLRELCAAPQPVVGTGRYFLRPLSKHRAQTSLLELAAGPPGLVLAGVVREKWLNSTGTTGQ